MFGLVSMIGRLEYAKVQGEIWIDGSFVTEKIDPNDVDILLHVKADFYNSANTDQQEAVDWVASNLKTTHRCDSYVWIEEDRASQDQTENEWWRSYWIRQFGFSRDAADLKGMALYILPAGGP